jgi:site-specific DNA-methyltransferase (adenine-specific)
VNLLPAFTHAPAVNRVYQCDYLHLMRACADHSIDAIISDPPYNMTELAFEMLVDWLSFWNEARRILKHKTSPVILFSQQPFTTDLINSNRKGFRYEIIWEKTMAVGFLDANRRPLRAHENVIVFADGMPEYTPFFETSTIYRAGSPRSGAADHYNKHVRKDQYEDTGKRYPRSVWRFAQRNTSFKNTESLHPTAKPLALMERLILTYTQPGWIILDPFLGSGTTALAALQNSRQYIGGDTDAKYVNVARERLAKPYTPNMFEMLAEAAI